MAKVGMVLEGGSMRGIYTAGVLDVLMENDIEVDGIVSVSAGALFGVNYFSKQIGRVIRYNKKYCGDKRFISIYSLIKTRNVVNKDFTFYKVTKELDPFDNDKFKEGNKDFYVTATNIETGKAEYFKIDDVLEQLETFRATAAVPFASEIIEIDGKKYLDGGISDSIPINKCLDLGYKKIIVILTQPLGFRKIPFSKKRQQLLRIALKKYPNLVDAMLNRYAMYNEELDKVRELEEKGDVFVIRPSRKINMSMIEKDPDKIQEYYDMGVEVGKSVIEDLRLFLDK